MQLLASQKFFRSCPSASQNGYMGLSPKSNYEKKIVSCFDIGEVPRSPGKGNWNWLSFLPFSFSFEQCDNAPQVRSCYPPNTFSICSYYILPSSFFHSFLGVHQQRNFQHNSQTFKPGVATRHYTPQYNGLKLILKEHLLLLKNHFV